MWGVISHWAYKLNQSLTYLRTPTLPFAPNSDDVVDPFQMWLRKEKTPLFKYHADHWSKGKAVDP